MEILAQCVAEAGYGTGSYDIETGECTHESYATVVEVRCNAAYWRQYGESSIALSDEFELWASNDTFLLTVYRDGTKTAEPIERYRI